MHACMFSMDLVKYENYAYGYLGTFVKGIKLLRII